MRKENFRKIGIGAWIVSSDSVGHVGMSSDRAGIPVEDICAASQGTPMGTTLQNESATRKEVMGCLWDCAVVIRERMVPPMSPHYAAIKKVTDVLMAHLGPENYELFLRPNKSVGLPPA